MQRQSYNPATPQAQKSKNQQVPERGHILPRMLRGEHGEMSAATAYDAMAPIYEEFNEQNDHELWVGETLLPELEKHGLQVGRVLDVGCGTGKAFPPLLDRGWEVRACDTSPEMLRRAKERVGADHPLAYVRVFCADARDLQVQPWCDLILLLNDVLNYLTEDGDLERCFSGVEKNLAPGGLVCFDANTISLFRAAFTVGSGLTRGKYRWRGLTEEVTEGGRFEAEVHGPGVESHVHHQRHWRPNEIREALEKSGLTALAFLGQTEEGPEARPVLREPLDEEKAAKAIWIAGHSD